MRTTTMISILVLAVAFTKTKAVKKDGGGPPKKMKFSKSVDEFEAADEEHEQDMKDVAQMERIVKLCPTQGPNNC